MDFDDLGPTLGTPLRIPDTAHRGPDCRESAEGVASVYEWRDKGSLGLWVEGFRVSGLSYASLLDNGASGAGVVGFFRVWDVYIQRGAIRRNRLTKSKCCLRFGFFWEFGSRVSSHANELVDSDPPCETPAVSSPPPSTETCVFGPRA